MPFTRPTHQEQLDKMWKSHYRKYGWPGGFKQFCKGHRYMTICCGNPCDRETFEGLALCGLHESILRRSGEVDLWGFSIRMRGDQ